MIFMPNVIIGLKNNVFHFDHLLILFSRIFIKGRKETVFLLCGSDESVHMFCEVS